MSDTTNKPADAFLGLTPDHILEAVEQTGVRSTGRFSALNSLENRVYDVEMEDGRPVVGKFYRSGRWSKEQILEEHLFLSDLATAEVPVVSPLKLRDGSTLGQAANGVLFAVFPKVRGRVPQELSDDDLLQIGRFIGRMHNVGAKRQAPTRVRLNTETYGRAPLDFLLKGGWIPPEIAPRYKMVIEEIIRLSQPWFEGVANHRLHGDCHLGNLLHSKDGFFFLDFDDMVSGPAAQDLWLLMPGHDQDSVKQRDTFLRGYETMREFDRSTLRLIEPLRALRIVHYSAWVARRWDDQSFKRLFTEFNTFKYWESETRDLQKQLEMIQEIANPSFH